MITLLFTLGGCHRLGHPISYPRLGLNLAGPTTYCYFLVLPALALRNVNWFLFFFCGGGGGGGEGGALRNFLGGKKITALSAPKVPVRI